MQQRIGILREQRLQVLLRQNEGIDALFVKVVPLHPVVVSRQHGVRRKVYRQNAVAELGQAALLRRRSVIRMRAPPKFQSRAQKNRLRKDRLHVQHRPVGIYPHTQCASVPAHLHATVLEAKNLAKVSCISKGIGRNMHTHPAQLYEFAVLGPCIGLGD